MNQSMMIVLCALSFMIACDDDTSPRLDLNGGEVGSTAGSMMGGGIDLPLGGETAGTNTGMTAGTPAGSMVIGGMMMGMPQAGTTSNPPVGGNAAGETAGNDAGNDAGSNAGETAGDTAGNTAGEMMSQNCTVMPDWTPAAQEGSIYLTHYLTSEVIHYRIDGDFPIEAGRFNVGGEPQDADINAHSDLYAVALNLTQEVELYRLPEPAIDDNFVAPQQAATIDLSPYSPRRVFFDSARQRLFVFANAPLDGGLLEEMHLFMYDVSNPTLPMALTAEPTVMPVSTALAIEPRAGILAFVELETYHLYLYDVNGDRPVLHQGDPIDLMAAFPEDGGQTGFQVRNLRFDPLRGRLYMARSHGIASEVITYRYPPVETKPDQEENGDCPQSFSYADLTAVPDAFEVAIPVSERENLLDSFMALPMIGEEFILFINYAWRTNSIASMVTLMRDDGLRVTHEVGCADFDGFGCFYTSYFNGSPSPYNHLTDGPGCVDQTHGVFAGAGLEDDENTELFLFRINRTNGVMTPWLTDTGRNLSTSQYPLVLSCY